MNIQHNNRNVPVIWWPLYAALLFILIILGMGVRIIEAIMTYMEIEE